MVRCSSFLQQQSTLYRRCSTLLLLLGAVVSFTLRSPPWLSVYSSSSYSYSYIRRRLTLTDYTSSSRYRSAADSRRSYRSDVRAKSSAVSNEDKSSLLIDSPRSISTDDEDEDHSTEGVSVIDCFNVVNADGSDVDASKLSSIDASQRFSIDPSLLGFLLLNAVAVLWGSQHVVIKASVDSYPTTSLVNFWRFLLSTLLFSPSLIKLLLQQDGPLRSSTLRAGVELGLYTFLGFSLQAVGLETTTAARSAFLLYLNVKMVPFLAYALYGRSISTTTWTSALLALTGTCLLSTDGGPIVVGDWWCVAAALSSALFILRLETFAQQTQAAALSSVSFATVAVLCCVWVLCDSLGGGSLSPAALLTAELTTRESSSDYSTVFLQTVVDPILHNPLPVVYLGVISTGLCNFLQTIGQRVIPAERAAIIYSMDPVYGAAFSWLLLNERFGLQGFVGAGCILLGVFVSSMGATVCSQTSLETADSEGDSV